MRTALIVDENRQEREVAVDCLQRAGLRVTVAGDHAAAIAVLDHEATDVAVVSWGTHHAPEIVRKVRACADQKRRTWVIALLDGQPASTIPSLFEVGVDDFVRRPFSREELVARAAAPLRIAGWNGGGVANGRDLTSAKAFKSLGPVVCAELSQILGAMDLVDGWLVAGELHGASLPMCVVSDHVDIRVSLGVEVKLAHAMATALLGDPDAPRAALEDMLCELANTAGGAVKRAAAEEDIIVTTGLPVSDWRGPIQNELTRCWTASVAGLPGRVAIIGEVHKQTTVNLPAAKLQEGMVLTHDLRNDAGALVLPAGTRLTATSVARVSRILGARFMVEVAEA